MKHPMQTIVLDNGTPRFQENKIVRYLLDIVRHKGICDMNQLAILPFDNGDREQFAQLIGYSVSGFLELSYVSDEAVAVAEKVIRDSSK